MSSANPAHERHWVCAQRLRTRRLALGLTQLDVVARLQQRGYTTTSRGVSAMENARGLDLGLLPELAAVLDCTVTYLLGLTVDPWAWHPGELNGADRSRVTALRVVPSPVSDAARVAGAGPGGHPGAPPYRTRWRDPGSGP